MYTTILVLIALAAALLCGWLYWQMQQRERRLAEQEAQISQKAILVGELADEITMASQYLYEAMDRCLAELEAHGNARTHPESSQTHAGAEHDRPAQDAAGPDGVEEENGAGASYHPYFEALALAARGTDLVEIARHTGLGIEELRLLLHFREELSVAG